MQRMRKCLGNDALGFEMSRRYGRSQMVFLLRHVPVPKLDYIPGELFAEWLDGVRRMQCSNINDLFRHKTTSTIKSMAYVTRE